MTDPNYAALIISLVSIVTALFSLFWNVWQKFLFIKPSLYVTFQILKIYEPTQEGKIESRDHRLISISVTNMGPGPAMLHACIVRTKKKLWARSQLGLLNPIHGDPTSSNPTSIGPFSSGLPMKIDAGEIKSFYFPYNRDCFLKEGVICAGVNDTYQRNTWCKKSYASKVATRYKKDFPTTD